MCLAVPMELVRVDGSVGVVHQSGVELTIALDLLEAPQVGVYVVVHAGFAIQSVPRDEALETLAIIERFT